MNWDKEIEVPSWLQLALWAFMGWIVGGTLFMPLGEDVAGVAGLLATVPAGLFGARYMGLLKLSTRNDELPKRVAPMLEGGKVTGAQAAGEHEGQAVRFWTERGSRSGEIEIHCSVRAPRGQSYLDSVDARELDIEPFTEPGTLSVRPRGIRAAWTSAASLDGLEVRSWVEAILAEADARLTPDAERLERLVGMVEDGKPSALVALAAEAPEHPRLTELAERLSQRPEPAARLVGAEWLGAEALETLIDDLAHEPEWQAKALRARSEASELAPDAVSRWAGVPALRLELLIDQVRRGAVDVVDGLANSTATWIDAEDDRLKALAEAVIERGPDVESAACRLFGVQPAGRRHLAQALGEIGGMRSLATLRAASAAVDWPQFDEDEAAVDGAMARIIHRLGDAAAGMLALDQHEGEVGGLSLDASAGGRLTVAGQTEHE